MLNRLTRIVTRSGDKGSTGLADGSRLEKSSPRIYAIGEVDELNSAIGLLLSEELPANVKKTLQDVQHDLFDLGGELSLPNSQLIKSQKVSRLEEQTEQFNTGLPALREFVLPGGSRAASLCHLCRSVCRRAERSIVALGQTEHVASDLRQYINRLSDLLFVLARVINQAEGVAESVWDRTRKPE